jgi:hypothetical protein
MAAAIEDHQQVQSEEDSKSSSMNPVEDIEKKQLSDIKDTDQGNPQGFQRPVNGFKWFLVCVGLYLGAVLYGEKFCTGFIKCKPADMSTQASTQQLRQMYKAQSSKPSEK